MSQRDKPRLALNNITAGVRERQDANRTRVAWHLDEIQGVVASTLNLFRNGAVGFIDWLDATLENPTTPLGEAAVSGAASAQEWGAAGSALQMNQCRCDHGTREQRERRAGR